MQWRVIKMGSDLFDILQPLGVANLDGLLAALFTRPYLERNCSVNALLDRHRLDSTALERIIAGVRDVCTKWKELTNQECSDESEWLSELLRDYDAFQAIQPLPGAKRGTDISAAMTLDPSLGYASRQPYSDGRISRKVNLTMLRPRFATLLAESARPLLRPRYHDGLEQVTDHSQDDKQ